MKLPSLLRAGGTSRALLISLVIILSGPSFVSATEDSERVSALLGGMSKAVRELDYRGLFTYEYGGVLETLRIVHAVRDGVEFERLQHLSGPEREVLRQGQAVDCLQPGDQLLQGRFKGLESQAGIGSLEDNYHFYIRGDERVAGRDTTTLQVVPKDEFRFGYTLAIDKQTGMLLKSLLVGNKKRVLERFQFIELELGPMIAEGDYQPQSPRHRVVDHRLADCNQKALLKSRRWQTAWLPAGFIFTGQQQSKSGADMLMYTDGLTTFSVFIESVKDPVMLEGRAQRGGTVAYMSRLMLANNAYRVTVVGEVPPVTAQRVSASIRSLPSDVSQH